MVATQEYGDLHRAVLQTLMGYGTIEKKQLETIVRKLAEKFQPNGDEDISMDRIVEMINGKISRFDQKVSVYEYGLTNDEFFVFHSTAATATSKMQNTYTENELDFFKLLLKKITESESLRIAPRDALNLSSELNGKINKARAQNLIDNWISSHYFFKFTDNRIYLGAKSLTEFRDYLQSAELDTLKSCILCENIVIWGTRCPTCDVIFHTSCLKKYQVRSDQCPSCRSKFSAQPANEAEH